MGLGLISTLIGWIKEFIAGIAWNTFLWGIRMTEDQYLDAIYEQEKKRRDEFRGKNGH